MDNEEKANAIVERMEKKLNSYSMFGKTSKLEEAEEEFQKAANLYKLAKNWDRAGETFKKLAGVQLQLGNKHQAATAYTDAANAYRKSNTAAAVSCLKEASEIFTDIGKFSPAAKVQKEMGEILEAEENFHDAIKAYLTSADYFSGENSQSLANGCRLKAATLHAQVEEYSLALEIFEQVGMTAVDSPLTRFNAKEYFFKAGLCHLCTGDIVAAERAIEKYCHYDATFSREREHKLLAAIIEAHKKFDVDEFTAAVTEFDSISKLDTWKTTILLKIKTSIKSGQIDVL